MLIILQIDFKRQWNRIRMIAHVNSVYFVLEVLGVHKTHDIY